jgi:very-short-patch-repair endonuclease
MTPALEVADFEDICAALDAASRRGLALQLVSPVAGACYLGAAYWQAMESLAREAFPSQTFRLLVDCGDESGTALQAMALGLKHVVFDLAAPALPALTSIAHAYGAQLLPRPSHMHAFPAGLSRERKMTLAQSWLFPNPSPSRGEAGRGAEAESYVSTRPHPNPPPTGEGALPVRTLIRHNTLKHARQLRKSMTDVEQHLWKYLRGKQLGVKFRKQHPVGPFIADFAAPEVQLIIELDGGQHAADAMQTHDEARTHYLQQNGYRVLRFWNHEVSENIDGVLAVIHGAVAGASAATANMIAGGVDAVESSTPVTAR